jgi:hypothetical protein
MLLAAVPLLAYHRYLSADALLYAYDHAQLQFPRYAILCEALQRHGEFPLWQTLLYAGSPFHANPEMPTVYPPVLALAAVFPPVLVMNLGIVGHLVLAALGMHLLVARLWRRAGGGAADAAVGGLVAGCAFAFNSFTRLDLFNLVGYGFAHALLPWMLLAVEGVLHGGRPRRAAATLALLFAAQVATGGLYVFAYTALGLGLWCVCEGLLGGAPARRRALTWLPVACAGAAVLVAARLSSYADWVAGTNRAGALPPALARGVTLGGHAEFAWERVAETVLQYTGHGLLLLLVALALPALRHRAARTALGLALLGFVLALGGVAHEALVGFVPPFDRIRNAIRAWTLANAWLPIVAGLGVANLLALARRALGEVGRGDTGRGDTGRAGPAHAVAIVLVLGTLPFWLDTGRHQEMLDAPLSYAEVRAHTPHWQRAAALAGTEWRAAQEDVGSLAGKNEQFIATAAGVEIVNGQLGNVWPPRLERHVNGGEGRALSVVERRKRLGVLSVRPLVTAHRGSLPVGNWVSDSGEPYPLGIDGTGVDTNPHARPRALLPAGVVGLFGDTDDVVLYALLDSPAFEPARHSVVSLGRYDRLSDEALDAFDAVVVVERAATIDQELLERLDARAQRGLPVVRVGRPLLPGDGAALARLARTLDATDRAAVAGTLVRDSPQRTRVSLPDDDGDGATRPRAAWLVVSEGWSLHDGWRITTESDPPRELTSFRADGVVSALLLQPGERAVRARYAPSEARAGAALGGAGLALVLALLLWPARRRPQGARPPGPSR